VAEEWSDINDPGVFKSVKPLKKSPVLECITDAVEPALENTSEEEVTLSDPQFFKGDEGFQFNKKCRVRVKVDYLKETFRKQMTFALFSEYNGEVQDMQHAVNGEEQDGVAEAEITLYYNEAHYNDFCNDPSITVDYFFKASHPRGTEIESPRLTMPRDEGAAKRVRMVGMLFDSDKCFLLPEALPGIKAIIAMHRENERAEVLIVGHADGDEDLAGADIALDRAKIVAAYLTNKPDEWLTWFGSDKDRKSRWGTREVQLMLSVLPQGGDPFYQGNASGVTGEKTSKAVKAFQDYYNKEKGGSLTVDGKPGANTCKALVTCYMEIEDTTLGSDIVPVFHGCEGHFDDTITQDGLVADDRRLEVFFFEKGIDPKPEADTSTPESSHYKDWVDQVTETKDFEHHGLHVLLVDAKKKPVPGAKVTYEGPTSGEGEADNNGFVTLTDLKAGSYTIHAQKEGFTISDSTLVYPTAKTVEVEIDEKEEAPTESGGLNLQEKLKIVRMIAQFEGGGKYTALNKDYEFEGRWDLPKGWYKNKSKAKPDTISKTVTYSKYSGAPRHVGLSFGLIQFTQESSLGALVKKMADKDLETFKSTFGEHYQELLDTLTKTGAYIVKDEEIIDNCGNSMGTKQVKRKPSVQPVAGHEVWSDYWTPKFKASGGIDSFKKCQEELAVSAYFDPVVKAGKGMRASQKSLCLLYDRSVNQGSGFAQGLVKKLKAAEKEQDFWNDYIPKQKEEIKTRLKSIFDNNDMKWEVVYDL
jgi:outer membrane protein OmpA-like peptidoglycan-associated protein